MSGNTIVISENNNLIDFFSDISVSENDSDTPAILPLKNFKINKPDFDICVISAINENINSLAKTIDYIKNVNENCEILLLIEETDANILQLILDKGIYGYFKLSDDKTDVKIKFKNCLNRVRDKNIIANQTNILTGLGIIDYKTNLYSFKYLKSTFDDIAQNEKIKNGIFALITLDKKNKTKVAANRLGLLLKKIMRPDDIISLSGTDKFYVIFPNTNILNAKFIIEEIQKNLGCDIKIRAGISKICSQTITELVKNVSDSTVAAINNDLTCTSLTDICQNAETWLIEETEQPNKKYKLFDNLFDKKLNKVIEPAFYLFQREITGKLRSSEINQYANKLESVFSIKTNNIHSELAIYYDGYTKLKIKITHSGLNSAENSEYNELVNKINDKVILKYLKQLLKEHTESINNN